MKSKPLLIAESNDLKFVQESLRGDSVSSIGVATVMLDYKLNQYFIFEYLLCEETQIVTPHTSHPNRYWYKNHRKFETLFKLKKDLKARLFLINYAKPNTKHSDCVKVIEVIEINKTGIIKQSTINFTRNQFSKWYRELNEKCSN